MSHSITDDREYSSWGASSAPLAPLSSVHHARDSLRERTLSWVIPLHGSAVYGMTHDLPKMIRDYSSSK